MLLKQSKGDLCAATCYTLPLSFSATVDECQICPFCSILSNLPRVKEGDIEGQRYSQGQPPPVPDEVGNQGQDQLSTRVGVTCYHAHHRPHMHRDPLKDYKSQTKPEMMRLQNHLFISLS